MTLFIVLTLLDLLLARAVISDRGAWQWKFLAIVCACTLNFLVLAAFKTGDGWPTTSNPPKQAQFLGCYVVEPTTIYVWLTPASAQKPIIGYTSTPSEPRLYAFPYSRILNDQCAQAEKAVQQGEGVGFARPNGKHSQRGKYRFYKLPPPRLPDKVSKSTGGGA